MPLNTKKQKAGLHAAARRLVFSNPKRHLRHLKKEAADSFRKKRGACFAAAALKTQAQMHRSFKWAKRCNVQCYFYIEIQLKAQKNRRPNRRRFFDFKNRGNGALGCYCGSAFFPSVSILRTVSSFARRRTSDKYSENAVLSCA